MCSTSNKCFTTVSAYGDASFVFAEVTFSDIYLDVCVPIDLERLVPVSGGMVKLNFEVIYSPSGRVTHLFLVETGAFLDVWVKYNAYTGLMTLTAVNTDPAWMEARIEVEIKLNPKSPLWLQELSELEKDGIKVERRV
jgi:hypothetical protein